jgi:hypothetical protein
MRSSGVRGLLVYCAGYRCSHYIAISGDRWSVMFGCQTLSRSSLLGLSPPRGRRATGFPLERKGKTRGDLGGFAFARFPVFGVHLDPA